MEADDGENNTSEIEFVTDPIESKDDLNAVMIEITKKGNELLNHKNEKHFVMDNFVIFPKDKELCANPQMTFGMSLGKMNKFMNDNTNINEINEIQNQELAALVRLIRHYINQGQGNINDIDDKPLSYPKQIGDTIMARTDFVKLFSLLKINISEKEWLGYFQFKENEKLISCGVLIDGVDENDYINKKQYLLKTENYQDYQEKMKKYKHSVTYIPELTIKDWLLDIYNKKQDRLAKIEDHEGLGAMGDKVDKVNNEDVGIFEFRQLQKTPIKLENWKEFAIRWFSTVDDLNKSDNHSVSSNL